MHYSYPPLILLHGYNRSLLHTTIDIADKPVGNIDYLARTAVILGHFDHTPTRQHRQLTHILRISPSELKDILVIITDSNDSHILEVFDKSLDQGKIVGAHILRLINDQDRLAYLGWLHITTRYHLCSSSHHIIGLIQIAYSSEQVKTIRVEGLNFNKMGGVAYEGQQALLEFGSSSTRESEHKKLFVLDIFK